MTAYFTDQERYARQIELFGARGQELISSTTVAVIGLGGLGSHVCQQLAYLGVRKWIIIDDDPVDKTNLNRLIGATVDDLGRKKGEAAQRQILTIQPGSAIERVDHKVPNNKVSQAISDADVIMGCVDNDYPRMLVNELASTLHLPFIDSASGVRERDRIAFGGRVVVADADPGCLHCLGLLDQAEIRRAQMSPEELEVEARIYGVPVTQLTASGPSVVTVNGVVASLATTEFVALVTGLRTPRRRLTYRGDLGTVNSNNDEPEPGCYYCQQRRVGTD
jgi:molybdopterin/thiamine biosynthesis adenylyltransferase